MSDNVAESTLKRCYEEIKSPAPKIGMPTIKSPTFRQPAKRRNLTALLENDPKFDLDWLDANVIRRLKHPKRTERDAAIGLAMRKHEREPADVGDTWSILKRNVEYNIVENVLESLFDVNSKGKRVI
jgi:hypothetical protein